MLNKDYAGTSARIGFGALQRAAIPQNGNNWGLMLAQGINALNDKKAYDAEQAKLGAYSAALKEAHPEDAARIDAMGALEAGAYYDNLAKEQREQQYKLDYLDKQNANSYALAQFKANLENKIAEGKKTQQLAEIDNALANGLITEQQAKVAKAQMAIGDIVNGVGASSLPDGVTLTGNKKYDDAYMQEIGKKAAQKAVADRDMEEMKPTLIQSMAKADKAARSGNGVGLLGGFAARLGLNLSPNAGFNYADIQTANTQMNTYLRKQLEATGLTGSELNSALEAEAYRYQIKPTDSESIIRRKLQNFAQDKLGGTAFNMNTGQVVNQPAAVDYKNKYGLE